MRGAPCIVQPPARAKGRTTNLLVILSMRTPPPGGGDPGHTKTLYLLTHRYMTLENSHDFRVEDTH